MVQRVQDILTKRKAKVSPANRTNMVTGSVGMA